MDKFILYNTDDGKAAIKLYAKNNTVWLTQAQIAELFNTQTPAITKHISNIYIEEELLEESTCSKMEQVQIEGNREITRQVKIYNLDMILAIGFRIRSKRGTQFRKWANTTLKEYLLKGFVMDDERLKNPDGRPDYFDELLERIRDIRASEKRFYQKLKDLFALSSDYVISQEETLSFFRQTQNKLLYGVTGLTAAEIICKRADATKPNMGLTSWKGKIVRKADISTAKNYLSSDELDILNRLVSVFLETAELRVKLRKDLTLSYWQGEVDKLLTDNGIRLLKGNGKISHQAAQVIAAKQYDEFDFVRKQIEAQAADQQDMQELDAELNAIAATKRKWPEA